MNKIKNAIILLLLTGSMLACSTHLHTVGSGPKTGLTETATQWYALFGLVPINTVDTNKMAGEATDYQIKTETTFVDGLISAFTGYVTVTRRTVEVKK